MKLAPIFSSLLTSLIGLSAYADAPKEIVMSCNDRLYSHPYNEIIEVTLELGETDRLIVEYKNAKGKIKTDFGTYDPQKRKYMMADSKGTEVLLGTAYRHEGDGITSEVVFYYDKKETSRKQKQSLRCKRPLPTPKSES